MQPKKVAVTLIYLALLAGVLRATPPSAAAPTAGPALVPTTVQVPDADGHDLFATPRTLNAPPGFAVSVFAYGLRDPRMLVFGPDGALYVSSPDAGTVFRLTDADHNGIVDQVIPVATGLDHPHGLVFGPEGALYVAETTKVSRLKQIADGTYSLKTVLAPLPGGGQHTTRTLALGADGWLYVSIGSTCDLCVEQDPLRGTVARLQLDGSQFGVVATGLRNAVGLTWQPGTGQLWATENGANLLGADKPAEELDLITPGGDYGWPYCYEAQQPTPGFGSPTRCATTIPPVATMPAHSAPLGISYYPPTPASAYGRFPGAYRGNLYLALHGSSVPGVFNGGSLVRVPLVGLAAGHAQDFITGWRVNGQQWGRPVDPIPGPDGALYLSDDQYGVIYRITYAPGDPDAGGCPAAEPGAPPRPC